MGGLGEYPVCYCLGSLSLYFGSLVTHTCHTSGLILMTYTSDDVFPRKDDIAPNLGG